MPFIFALAASLGWPREQKVEPVYSNYPLKWWVYYSYIATDMLSNLLVLAEVTSVVGYTSVKRKPDDYVGDVLLWLCGMPY